MEKKKIKKRIRKYLKSKSKSGFFYDVGRLSYDFYLIFYRLWHNGVLNKKRELKYWFQRAFRGYSDCDLWGLDWYLSGIILKCLRAYKKKCRSGLPNEFCYKSMDVNEIWAKENKVPTKEATRNWDNTIQDMIDGFTWLRYSDDKLTKISDQYQKRGKEGHFQEWQRQREEAIEKAKKFVTHFNSLWD